LAANEIASPVSQNQTPDNELTAKGSLHTLREMEAPEVPTEHLHEQIQEHAEQHAPQHGWVMKVALSSAIVAALAAVGSLKAGHTANEALIRQIESSDQWNYYQAKGIKAGQLKSKRDILDALQRPVSPKDTAKIEDYEREQEEIKREAEKLAAESRSLLHQHQTLSHSVTMFQISIAVSAMSVLVRSRRLWSVSLLFAGLGVGFLSWGLMAAH
jgi:hypothetical protein